MHGTPGCCCEPVAIAVERANHGRRFLQHLWLIPLVVHRREQPKVVAGRIRVITQLKKMTTAQRRLVTFAHGTMAVALMPLQGPARQLPTSHMVTETTWVMVILKELRRCRPGFIFQVQRRMLEVMITAHRQLGTGLQAHVELPDSTRVGGQFSRRAKLLCAQAPKHRLVIAKYQQVVIRVMAKVVMNTLLFAQPLDKVQVGFYVLHAERPGWVDHGAKLEGISVRQDAVVFKDRRDNLRHTALLENPLVAPMGKARQARCQGEAIASESNARIIPANSVDLPMQPCIGFAEVQIGWLVKQRLQIQRRIFAD